MAAQCRQQLLVDHEVAIVERDQRAADRIGQPLGNFRPGLEIGGGRVGGERPTHIHNQHRMVASFYRLDPGRHPLQDGLEGNRRFEEAGFAKGHEFEAFRRLRTTPALWFRLRPVVGDHQNFGRLDDMAKRIAEARSLLPDARNEHRQISRAVADILYHRPVRKALGQVP